MKRVAISFLIILLHLNLFAQQLPTVTPPVLKQRIIKLDFFSPLTGNLTFGYEQALVNSITITGEAGIIGASFVPLDRHDKGMFLKGGAKFYFAPDYWLDGMKRYNDLQGFYFNPEIVYSGFGFDYADQNGVNQRGINNSFALMLHLGKQWVIANTISLEIYGGAGYGWSSISAPDYSFSLASLDDELAYKFSHVQVSHDVPLAFDAGFNIGVLLK
ncbi:MAG: DUF3575 domain-containing protein [Chitinophagales bacterium]